jgi:hypothetical protein
MEIQVRDLHRALSGFWKSQDEVGGIHSQRRSEEMNVKFLLENLSGDLGADGRTIVRTFGPSYGLSLKLRQP